MNSKIVIIGGGAAGISALSKLLEYGYKNVILLEAEKRIGGRIESVPFGANFVDLGAQWIHGEKNNVVYNMVHDYKVLDKTPLEYFNGFYFTSDGENKPIGKELADMAFWVLEHCDKEAKGNKSSSFGPIFIKKFENTLKNTKSKNLKDIDPETVQQFLEYFQKFDNFTNASDSWSDGPEATSARGYLEYWQCEGYEILNWKDHGYKTLFDFITKKLPNPTKDLKVEDKILFNKEVKNIDWLNTSNEFVKIKCSDGSEYDADHVIITVSLGVLKKFHKTLFTPELPEIKKNAIEGFSIGTVNKIFMEFEKPFWTKD
jgi:monoamine oxidase